MDGLPLMTRIVQLANFYGPFTGGLKTVLEELARCYTSAGVDRVLIAPGPTDSEETDQYGTRIFVRAPVVPGTGGYRMILRPQRLHTLLEGLRPDVVEVSDKVTLLSAAHWARQRGIPSTLLSHERIDAILSNRVPSFVPLGRTADSWNRKLARTFDTIICPSRFAWREFERIGATNAAVVPWGVDLHTFSPGANRVVPLARQAAVELICVGRQSKEKEPGLAIDVAADLCRRDVDVHLTMVGTGPMMGELERRAQHLPVTFTGHVHDRREIARLIAAADVTIAPCRVETFGLAVLESLACGTPVVTSMSGAASEVCGPTAGLAAPSDGAEMADAVVTLLRRNQQSLRLRARSRAEEFPWTRTADSVLAVHLGQSDSVHSA
jgi:glycosyltransferase involved in cell wall biosynthesis